MTFVFERSEAALANVNRRLAQFNLEGASSLGKRPLSASRVLKVRSAGMRGDWLQNRVEDTLVRLMAIVEDYSLVLLIEATEQSLLQDGKAAALWEHYLEKEVDTWEQRFASWKRLHGVDIAAFPSYEKLRGFIEARNSITHGLGHLTRKQLRNEARSRGRLNGAGIRTSGTRLVLGQGQVHDCALVLKSFVKWLDAEVAVRLHLAGENPTLLVTEG